MEMIKVESSHIKAIGYDEEKKVMRVEYSQATYEYYDIPKTVYEQVMNADSKGRSLRESVVGYKYKRVEA